MLSKGRANKASGELHGRAKLDPDEVGAIKGSNEFQHILAARFGVSQTLVGKIKRGELWKDI